MTTIHIKQCLFFAVIIAAISTVIFLASAYPAVFGIILMAAVFLMVIGIFSSVIWAVAGKIARGEW